MRWPVCGGCIRHLANHRTAGYGDIVQEEKGSPCHNPSIIYAI
jgi:hypothetical protein